MGLSVVSISVLDNVLQLTENAGKPKVTELDDLMFGDENIFWLDISVNALEEEDH